MDLTHVVLGAMLLAEIVIAIQAELGIPVKIVGVGEGVGDLIEFDPHEFAAALFADD